MPVDSSIFAKGASLLHFLRDAATLRKKRVPSYGERDRLIWLADVPQGRAECQSPFLPDAEFSDFWLEVRKKAAPIRPPVPKAAADWIRAQDLDRYDREPELLPEITVLVERKIPNPEAPMESPEIIVEKFPEQHRLQDHPEVEDAWLEYLVNHWEPWAEEERRWQEVQKIYEDVDFMRRRLEEAEERYELLLAVGLLQWLDQTGTRIKRHLLTAPAEINLAAARGILQVVPSATFELFRVELDMLDFQQQPRLDGTGLDERLEELDVQAWDKKQVGEILRILANRGSSNAQVDENGLRPVERVDETFRITYAPAIVLRERRPTAYEELMNKCIGLAETDPGVATTPPWERLLTEGEALPGATNPDHAESSEPLTPAGRIYFPLPTNDEQRKIAERLASRPYVLVKGPPGTGKSHTIANLICHLLATGERILVTAQAPKALTVLRDLLPGDLRNLCVTAFGSTREDHRLLEDSVRGILARKDNWAGDTQQKIEQLEHEISRLEGDRGSADRQLRECREAETYPHLIGRYQGTAAGIAKQLNRDREGHDWLPEIRNLKGACPLSPEEASFLADIHCELSEDRLNEIGLNCGDFELPDPEVFTGAVQALAAAEQEAAAARERILDAEVHPLRSVPDELLVKCRAFLDELEIHITRGTRVLGQLAADVVGDLLVGNDERWSSLISQLSGLAASMEEAKERIGAAHVDVPSQLDRGKLLLDIRRRLAHFKRGGRRGWWLLASREARETHYIEVQCRVDGNAPKEAHSLETLLAMLELEEQAEQFVDLWPCPDSYKSLEPRRLASKSAIETQALSRLVEFLSATEPCTLGVFPARARAKLAEAAERAKWERLIRSSHSE